MKIKVKFKLQDMWIGLFWKVIEIIDDLEATGISFVSPRGFTLEGRANRILKEVHLYICLIPCFPIHIQWIQK